MEPTDRGAGDSDDGDQLDRIIGGRNRGDEHHAYFGDRAHARDWGAQGHWSAARGYTVAVSAGSDCADFGGRHHRDSDWSGDIDAGAHAGAVGAGDAVLFVGDDWIRDLGGSGLVLRILPGEYGGEPRSY